MIEEIEKDIKTYNKLDRLAQSDGGKILVKGLKADIRYETDTICNSYKELSHIELIAHISSLNERRKILDTLLNAQKNKEDAKKALRAELK